MFSHRLGWAFVLILIPGISYATPTTIGRLGTIDELYVVSIGNNNGHKNEATLRYAEEDASDFATVMRQLGESPAENTILVQGDHATGVRRILLETNQRIRAATLSPDRPP